MRKRFDENEQIGFYNKDDDEYEEVEEIIYEVIEETEEAINQ